MKKIFTVAAIALFMMSSCTSETNPVNNPDNGAVLLKKAIITDEDGSYTLNIIYEGSQIKKVTYEGDETTYDNYTYTNGKLTQIDYYEGNEHTQRDIFEYNDTNQLSSFLRLSYDVEWGEKTVYTHNTDGTISLQEYFGDLNSQEQNDGTGVITMINGNITKYVETTSSGTTRTYNYTFDSKNSPYKNIAGFEVIDITTLEGGNNNILTSESDYDPYTVTYDYNDNDYPTESTETYDDGYSVTTQYVYE